MNAVCNEMKTETIDNLLNQLFKMMCLLVFASYSKAYFQRISNSWEHLQKYSFTNPFKLFIQYLHSFMVFVAVIAPCVHSFSN